MIVDFSKFIFVFSKQQERKVLEKQQFINVSRHSTVLIVEYLFFGTNI
jgi:hypothetical protein